MISVKKITVEAFKGIGHTEVVKQESSEFACSDSLKRLNSQNLGVKNRP